MCRLYSMDNSMEMEGDCTPVAMSPLKRISVSKAVIKAELRAALQQLSSHGLMHGAKWAAEQVVCESVSDSLLALSSPARPRARALSLFLSLARARALSTCLSHCGKWNRWSVSATLMRPRSRLRLDGCLRLR